MNQHHILVIDDDTAVREVLTATLLNDGYQVSGVSDGASALQMIQEQPIDIVITDLHMPGMD